MSSISRPTAVFRQLGAPIGAGSASHGDPAATILAGKNIGLLCDEPGRPDALTVFRAAVELGAHVSLVRPRLEDLDVGKTADTARMLGKLYDAVVCVAVPFELVRQLRDCAGVPVLDEASIGASSPCGEPLRDDDVPRGASDDQGAAWRTALLACLA